MGTHRSRSPGRQHRVLSLRAARTAAAIALVWVTVRAVNRRLRRVRGGSMSPTLRHGDLVLVLPLPVGCGPRVGDVVLAGDPREPSRETLKRVAALPGGAADLAGLPGIVPAGSVALAGDDRTASTDSRHYGAVSDRLLRGRVALRIWPDPGRIGTAPATRAPLT